MIQYSDTVSSYKKRWPPFSYVCGGSLLLDTVLTAVIILWKEQAYQKGMLVFFFMVEGWVDIFFLLCPTPPQNII